MQSKVGLMGGLEFSYEYDLALIMVIDLSDFGKR